MDNNPWMWKRSSPAQRTINVKANSYGSPQEEATRMSAKNGGVPSRIVKNLNEKLASVILDDQLAKDDRFLIEHDKEISSGLDKAEEDDIILKKQLTEEDLTLRPVVPGRSKAHPDAAYKHFMWQLSTIPEEQELRMMEHEATGTHPSFQHEDLESKLTDTSERLANLAIESTNLIRTLMAKEKLINELHRQASQTSAELNALMSRLDSTEKENAFLKYESRMLEKELEARLFRETNVDFLLQENRALKDALTKKNAQLGSPRSMFSRTASRLEAQLAELSRSSEIYSDDGVLSSSSGSSWPISELEHFRYGKGNGGQRGCKPIESVDMSLMDDFVEMEKLALVSVREEDVKIADSDINGDCFEEEFDWLQVVLKALIRQQRISNRGVTQLLEDVRIATGYVNPPNAGEHGTEGAQRLKDEIRAVEAKLQVETEKAEALRIEARNLRAEIETVREEKCMVEEQVESQMSMNEELDTQLTVAKSKLNEIMQKYSCLEVELEDKNDCCEELESTCLDLQLQLESVGSNEALNNGGMIEDEKQSSQEGWEITAASAKLAECQETILNLGKQLKALASPREAALFDKVFKATNGTNILNNDNNNNNNNNSNNNNNNNSKKNIYRHFSLRDQMLVEDKAKAIILYSPKQDEVKETAECDGSKTAATALAIVPAKQPKAGAGFLRRLLMRRKKAGGSKKSQ